MKVLLTLAVLVFLSTTAAAHSGGTDAMGCHIDHSIGIRHCH